MTDPKKEIRTYLMNLIHRYLYIKKLNTQLEIIKSWERPDRIDALNHGASFFSLTWDSFNKIILIDLSMLLSGTEQRSIKHWLSVAKKFAGVIEPTTFSFESGERSIMETYQYIEIIRQHQSLLQKQDGTIKNIKGRRNKALAHLDAEYFDDNRKLFSTYPISEDDIKSLLITVDTILREQHVHLHESDLDMEVYSNSYLDSVLKYTRAFKRTWEDKELIEKGFRPVEYLQDGLNYKNEME